MYLKSLIIGNFRNICSISLEPSEQFNLFYGLNGQGKTNLLEAIYILGTTRSFRNGKFLDFICHEEKSAHIRGEIISNSRQNFIQVILESSGRKTDINGKGIHRASELHGMLNTVVFSPDDTGMVKLGPDTRRRYIDRAVYQSDAGYLHCWHTYYRILKQRNQLLKSSDNSSLDVWTEKLAESGAEIIERRFCFINKLEPLLQQHYAMISGKSETVGIGYVPEGISSTRKEHIKDELLEQFVKSQRTDERMGTTTVGPHRDDLHLLLNSRSLRSFGSQGQQKSYVLALKMAEIDILELIYGESPLMLLDDMTSELDSDRNGNLMDFLKARGIQVFMTRTARTDAFHGFASNCAVFRVEDGNLTFEGSDKI